MGKGWDDADTVYMQESQKLHGKGYIWKESRKEVQEEFHQNLRERWVRQAVNFRICQRKKAETMMSFDLGQTASKHGRQATTWQKVTEVGVGEEIQRQ